VAPAPDLVLVPTALEEGHLRALGGFPAPARVALAGFGPVAAAARTMQLLAESVPRRVLLVGLAGSLDPARAPLASASQFAHVRLDGVGAGSGAAFVPASRLGFPQWADERGAVGEELPLAGGGALGLLCVCAASGSPEEADLRRARHADAAAEEMEAFGAALACRLAGVPFAVVRGISNLAGERDASRWHVRAALAAAHALALEWLAREWPA
jgi:futalosine hydrolase